MNKLYKTSPKCNVLVFGYFGKVSKIQEGQSVKTRNISRVLKELGQNVSEFDTESFRHDKLAFLKMFISMAKCDKLCLLPAYNNLKWIVPILFVFSYIFRFKLYYFTIGGRLHIYLQNLPLHRWMLRRIECIFNETHLLGKNLREMYGYRNLEYCPNFKFSRHSPVKHHTDGKLKLVFLARIVAEKGLDVIFTYCEYIKRANRVNVYIDFYGMVDEKDKHYFFSEVAKYPFVVYKGVAQQSDIPLILDQYDAMLFPTHYPTEGIPGSVLDAYISGIPVIASNWVYANELIDDGITGIIVPFYDNETDFINACESLLNDASKLNMMKGNAHKRSFEYHADNAKMILSKYFN